MFVLGHVGIGTRLLFGLRRKLPPFPLYLGCLLPDLLDKPLFYGLLALRRLPALISGTRTFGHTGLFLLLVALAAALARKPWLSAVAAGVSTHFALDIAGELVASADADSSIWLAIFYPASGRFPRAHFTTLLQHLALSAQSVYVVAGELLGAALLLAGRLRRAQRS